MAEISKIQLPSGSNPYDLKDATAIGNVSFSGNKLTFTRRDGTTTFDVDISGIMAANDAMTFKGTIGTGGNPGALPTDGYHVGDTYRVIVAGNYANYTCEVGDLIIAIKDYNSSTASTEDWTVAQTNIDGAVTTSDGDNGYLAKFNGPHSITKGPKLGSSTSKYLTEKGTWDIPATVPHTHGNINYDGTITSTGVALSDGDALLFSDSSNSGKIEKTNIIFDGSTTTKALTPKGTWETFTDKQLQIAAVTSGTTYYPIVGTSATAAATRQYDTNFIYKSTNGTSSATGTSILTIGNNGQKTTASREGQIVMYGSNTAATTLKVANTTTARTITFPDKTGTVLVGTFSAGTTPVAFSVANETLTITNGTAPAIS